KVLWRADAGFPVDGNEAVPERTRRKYRQRDKGALFVGKALNEFRTGIFRDVKFLPARHAVEDGPRFVDRDEVQIDAVRLDFARVERLHAIIEGTGETQLQT